LNMERSLISLIYTAFRRAGDSLRGGGDRGDDIVTFWLFMLLRQFYLVLRPLLDVLGDRCSGRCYTVVRRGCEDALDAMFDVDAKKT
jgi:hypothetical protein